MAIDYATAVEDIMSNPSFTTDTATEALKALGSNRKKGWSNIFKGKEGMGKTMGAGLLGLILYQYITQILEGRKESKMMNLQAGGMREQAEAIDPQAMMYQAMIPQQQASQQLAQEALIRQLLGTTGPSLARGESLVGR
jgi:hypothetical protein